MAQVATNTGTGKKKNFMIIAGIVVLIAGLLGGVYLVRSRLTTQNQAAEEFTHQITCTVGEIPEGKTCTVSVDGSPDSPQTVDPAGIGHPNYFFKVKLEQPNQEFTCELDCGIPACMPTDTASCIGIEPSNSPTPSPSPTPPTEGGECGSPCGDNIAQCRQDLFCNQDGKCDHETECPKPSVSPTVTPSTSPTPTTTPSPTPTPTGPTPTLPEGVTPSVTPTSTPRPTATVTPSTAPTPTTEIVCVPPDPVANLTISCTTGTCSWNNVSGSDKYKVAVTDTTTGKKLAGFEPFKEIQGTSAQFTAEAGHTYRCTVEAVNSCGSKQASSPYRDSQTCTTTTTSISPTPKDIIVVNSSPTPTPKGPTPTLQPGVSPSATPVPTLPVAGHINLSLWALVGVAAIVFGLIAFK